MPQCDEEWLSVADAFNAAAVGAGSWLEALSGLAEATGSRIGELIGLGSANAVPFNIITDLPSGWHDEFIAAGGGDPHINPYVRVGSQIPAMKVVSSAEFLTRKDQHSNDFLAHFLKHHDMQHICLTPLIKERGMLVGMAVIRSRRQGEIDEWQRALFTTLAPHVRAAVKTQMALEHQGALLVAGAMEALTLAVFVCDRLGVVKAMTPAAENLVSKGTTLRLKSALLSSAYPAEAEALRDAIAAAAAGRLLPGIPLTRTVLVGRAEPTPLVVEVVSLPRRELAFGFEPRALVIARRPQPDPERLKHLLQLAYRLTAAEVDVTLRLVEGQAPELIAMARGAAVGTVRAQIRAIYTKLGVHHRSELAARINPLR